MLPLSGSCTVSAAGTELELAGRSSVFSGVSDFGYVPRDATVTISSAAGGRFALPGALASRQLPVRYGAAAMCQSSLRGAGQASRQVNNFCRPDAFECDKLVAVEVLTPAGNWSSYPPHKHDRPAPGEAVLEEIYYFELAEAERGTGMAYQRVYSSGRTGRSTSWPRSAAATPCWCRTAITGRRWPLRAIICTTSTCWPARQPSGRWRSVTTRHTPGSAAPGSRSRRIRGCR